MAEKLGNPFKISELIETVNNLVDTTVDDSNLVHKTENENITGFKTFIGNNRIIALQNSTVTYDTAPSSVTFTDISFRDKNGYEMGVLEHVRYANNDTTLRLVAKGADGDWSTSLTVGRKADGTVYATAPTPATSDNSTNIATTAWVKNQGYMSSGNIFPNGTWVPVGDDAYMGDSNHSGAVCFKGNNDNTKLILINRAQNVALGFYIDENDNNGLKLTSPTYSATAWGSVTAMTAQSLSGNGYIKFNHGLIIQWGSYNATSSKYTLTFPTTFTSTNYGIVAVAYNNLGHFAVVENNSRTKTTVNIIDSTYENIWIAIGY